jgi:hypothetical protein
MICHVCNQPLLRFSHDDPGDESFTSETYWECGNKCPYPDTPDSLLTPKELAERGRVDTMTEFGIININQNIGSEVL